MSPEIPKTLIIERKDDFYLWLESKWLGSRFFTKPKFLNYLPLSILYAVLAITGVEGANFVFSNSFLGDFKPLIGAMSYAVGAIVDEESTIRVSNAVTRLENRTGTSYGFTEAFQQLRKVPQIPNEDFFNSFRVRTLNATLCALSILLPQVGVAVGIGKLYAGWHNERVRALHERKLTEYLNG